MSTAYYAQNIGDPSPNEWDELEDNELLLKPYGVFVKLNIKNIETLCPPFSPYISGANCKLFAFLPKCINGGFLLGNTEYNDISDAGYNNLFKDRGNFSGWYSGYEGRGQLNSVVNVDGGTTPCPQGWGGRNNYTSAWFLYGLSCYDSINVTSLRVQYTDWRSNKWYGTFPWGGADPIATGITLKGWSDFRDYVYMDYETCSKRPDNQYIGSDDFSTVTKSSYTQTIEPKAGCLPFFTKRFAPLFFRMSFRGANGEKLSSGTWKAFGFGDNHNLNIYIEPDTGELHVYFYTNQSCGYTSAPTSKPSYYSSFQEQTQAITTPCNVLNFLISPKTLSYSTNHRPRNTAYPDSIVWEKSASLDLNNVFYNIPKIFRLSPRITQTSSTQRFFPVSAPKEMQTYLPMLGLENSIGSVVPEPTPRTTEKGYTFTGTWNTTANTWS